MLFVLLSLVELCACFWKRGEEWSLKVWEIQCIIQLFLPRTACTTSQNWVLSVSCHAQHHQGLISLTDASKSLTQYSSLHQILIPLDFWEGWWFEWDGFLLLCLPREPNLAFSSNHSSSSWNHSHKSVDSVSSHHNNNKQGGESVALNLFGEIERNLKTCKSGF